LRYINHGCNHGHEYNYNYNYYNYSFILAVFVEVSFKSGLQTRVQTWKLISSSRLTYKWIKRKFEYSWDEKSHHDEQLMWEWSKLQNFWANCYNAFVWTTITIKNMLNQFLLFKKIKLLKFKPQSVPIFEQKIYIKNNIFNQLKIMKWKI
jgi:hypothetical protein